MGHVGFFYETQSGVAPLKLFLALGPKSEFEDGLAAQVDEAPPIQCHAMVVMCAVVTAQVAAFHVALAGDAPALAALHAAGRGRGPPLERMLPRAVLRHRRGHGA